MNDVIFRPLNFSDNQEIARVARIHVEIPFCWRSNYQVDDKKIAKTILDIESSDPSKNLILLALSGQEIIGFHWLTLEMIYGELACSVHSLWVRDDWNKRGIGSHLKREGETWAKTNGAKFLRTHVNYKNQRMIDFNCKLGYVARSVEMLKDLD